MKYSIAIDGPSGAGKSTLARLLADKIGFVYLDTGAIYRTVGLVAMRLGVDPDNLKMLEPCFDTMQISIRHANGVQRMFLREEDVTDKIRTPEMSVWATIVAGYAPVRGVLLDLQRDFAKYTDVVMDGRDIGTVVLPQATVKIFLTASVEKRATRRYDELIERGTATSYDEVLSEMKKRDKINATREISPERPADDAVILDTTEFDLAQSLSALVKIVETRIGSTTKGQQ